MHVLSVSSLKGGVGKTTVTLGLASAAFARGVRTLVVDLDPQSDVSTGMDIQVAGRLNVADVLANPLNHLKRRLEEGSTVVAGQKKADPTLGTTCDLTLDDLLHSFTPSSRTREPAIRVVEISSKLGVKPRRTLETMKGSGLPPDPRPALEHPPMPAKGRLCAGGRSIAVKINQNRGSRSC